MRRFAIVLAALALLPVLGLAQQLDSNSITVAASRNTTLQPDQAVFIVSITSPLTSGLTDVLAVVPTLGLTAANLQSVRTTTLPVFTTTPPSQTPTLVPTIEWDFSLAVPLAKLKDTLTSLTNLQKSVASTNPLYTLSFNVQNTQVSQQAQQSQACSIADLLSDARAQAQKLADAGGLNLGVILAMSSTTSTNLGVTSSLSQYTLPTVCTLTVKFAATRY